MAVVDVSERLTALQTGHPRRRDGSQRNVSDEDEHAPLGIHVQERQRIKTAVARVEHELGMRDALLGQVRLQNRPAATHELVETQMAADPVVTRPVHEAGRVKTAPAVVEQEVVGVLETQHQPRTVTRHHRPQQPITQQAPLVDAQNGHAHAVRRQ